MKIGVLATGPSSPPVREHFGRYSDLTGRWITQSVAGQMEWSYEVFKAYLGELPQHTKQVDAYVVCGSPYGVYEEHEFIQPLEDFVRAAAQTQKIVGICFGHQLVAQAFGGKVEKSSSGWGIGVQSYRVDQEILPLTGTASNYDLLASHQDQVIEVPGQAEVYASNDFCPCAGMVLGKNILTVQGHPEWDAKLANALYDYRQESYGPENYKLAVNSLDSYNGSDDYSALVRRFLLDE